MVPNNQYINVNYPSIQEQLYQTSELYVTNAGIQNCRGGHSYGPAARKNYHLHFVLAGKGVFKAAGQRYALEKGDVFLVNADERVFYRADEERPWQYAWVTFNGENAKEFLEYAGFTLFSTVQRSRIPNETYLGIIEEIIQERELNLANELARTSRLYRLLSILVEAQHVESRPGHSGYDYPRETYVEYAKEFIHFHYAHIKIGDVANYVGVNRSYLTMIFKKVLGVSPQEYLVRYRLEKAAGLLRNTEWPLREIARRVGYEDSFTFSKMFKLKHGVSPSVYRAQPPDEPEGAEGNTSGKGGA